MARADLLAGTWEMVGDGEMGSRLNI